MLSVSTWQSVAITVEEWDDRAAGHKHPARDFLVESGERGRESFSGELLPIW